MKNTDGIKPHEFKEGESGNPNGRPKGVPNSKTRLLRLLTLIQKVKNPVTGEIEDFTVAEQMDMKMIAKALGGDIQAYKEIMERMEGKAKQEIEQSGKTETDLTIRIVEQKPI